MSKIEKFKYLFVFLIINFFLLDETVAVFFMISVMTNEKLMAIKSLIALPYLFFVMINKFYLLPLISHISIKYSKHQEISKFFLKWKSSLKIQIIFLCISFIIMPIIFTILSLDNIEKYSLYGLFKTYFELNLKMGLYQAYLILYFYWLIEYNFETNRYLKSFKQKKIVSILKDFYTLIKCLKIKNIIDFIKTHWLFILFIIILISITYNFP